ncbi:MAG TPA: imidazole glycerol phosphate synthase subunit HisH [Candidatus Nitrosotalea sp.]|nr:imidazole glycerol phosphate synthase subunit HisH [Nitrososphaerota archaeon]HKU32856.1 imidazole glycerol phosphate synthase subunit HisH [Candidatus Nitrosotalea sp.]
MVKVAIFDYGAGNIFSLKSSLEKNGAEVNVITDLDKMNGYSGLLLPGVGNFDPAIKSLSASKVAFEDLAKKQVPVLGICLGMEMFFEKSEEGKLGGLGVLGGEVVILPNKLKIPHMGWNDLQVKKPSILLEGVKEGSWVYFVHSYRVKPKDENIVKADSDYGISVPAVIESGSLFGTQFHPEKSGKTGAQMIKNFLRTCKK